MTEKMNKTDRLFLVSACFGWGNREKRRVWEKDGRFFIKYRGKVIDVTERRGFFC